ncbi:acyl-CoA--6-aminopenicillanic acid acyltransferase [Gramella sp. MT6]|uniref:C45 family autoproteolytic acyltransferase/hydolase n=1 Tax=Gramella sp. MT6 TaxID=2705471 RepID=UPI001C5D1E4D|nr:C45 family peptidase [Gramella sp. MT6]QYA25898.1 acyl-CoA--6-aminopenicillanic acid acyltransferase [Gramella sp. MT6]
MQLHFNAVSEDGLPGRKWQKLFNTHWSAYKTWLLSKGKAYEPDLKTSQAALKKYMPEMWPTYKRLCKLAKADDVAARFLTGFQPPAYISACSNAVLSGEEIQLVRNYDYHPDLMEGTQLLSAWNGKKVIATSDCLIGVVDGMNEDGLAISLTFGGRKEVGVGFGIPFILRYVLEFSSNVEEAVAALIRIPSHMSYNVTIVDKTGAFKTVRLAPDKDAVVTNAAFTTNHQGAVDWPENAAFNKTLERSAFLEKILAKKGINATKIADAFLKKPLYNTQFKEGFGTLFTSVYRPLEGVVEMRWPGIKISQSFQDFQEQYKLIEFDQPSIRPEKVSADNPMYIPDSLLNNQDEVNWQETVTAAIANAMATANPDLDKEELKNLQGELIHRGEVSWEVLADFWSRVGTDYGRRWYN